MGKGIKIKTEITGYMLRIDLIEISVNIKHIGMIQSHLYLSLN